VDGNEIVLRGKNPEGWSPWWRVSMVAKPSSTTQDLDLWTQKGPGQVASSGPPTFLRTAPHEDLWPSVLLLHDAGTNYRLKGNVLEISGREIRLGRGHAVSAFHSFSKNPVANELVVASIRTDNDVMGYRSFVDVVDLNTGGVKRLVMGKGAFAARFDPLGKLQWRMQGVPGSGRDTASGDLPWWALRPLPTLDN
jgi:hypothetical protein